MLELSHSFYRERKLEHQVENKTSYTLDHAAMHIFETHEVAEKVVLQFEQPVLASMLQGKKIMHLRDLQSFDFLPGESLILPSNEKMSIDFPEAHQHNPTRCLAMAISEEKIQKIIETMNDEMPRQDDFEWGLPDYNFHFTNDVAIYQILQRLIYLFTENHASKDIFVDFMLKELVIRILQSNLKKIYSSSAKNISADNRMAFIVDYIRKNLDQSLSVSKLSQKAYMSESNFHRVFKNETGLSPVDFINNERIKLAVSLLQQPGITVKEVFMQCGFENRSYFNRVFKQATEYSPGEFQKHIAKA